MSGYTPGPWDWYWRQSDGETDCGVYSEKHQGHAYSVCRAPRYQTEDQWAADARLIAAAPELLEALEQLIGPEDDPKAGWRGWTPSTEMFRCEFCGQEDLDCGRVQHDNRCPIKAARAAIAKATGEQS